MTFNLQTLQHTSGTYHKETSPKNLTPRPACIHQIFDFPISYQTHRVEEPSRHTIDQAYSTFYKTNLSWKIAHSKYRQKR